MIHNNININASIDQIIRTFNLYCYDFIFKIKAYKKCPSKEHKLIMTLAFMQTMKNIQELELIENEYLIQMQMLFESMDNYNEDTNIEKYSVRLKSKLFSHIKFSELDVEHRRYIHDIYISPLLDNSQYDQITCDITQIIFSFLYIKLTKLDSNKPTFISKIIDHKPRKHKNSRIWILFIVLLIIICIWKIMRDISKSQELLSYGQQYNY